MAEKSLSKNFYDKFKIDLITNILKIDYDKTANLSCLLDDGRLGSCLKDNKIIIYYKKEFRFKNWNTFGRNILYIALKPNILVGSSSDKAFKMFKIKNNNCEIMQSIDDHKDEITYILALNNKILVYYALDGRFTKYYKK